MNWNIADAKNRFSEVLNRAEVEVQTIIRRDRDYVILAGDEYRKLVGRGQSFTEFLISAGPRFDEIKPMKRRIRPMREVNL